MAYKSGETMRLEEVRDLGIEPNAILDVGAHSGQFYGWAKRVWPMCPIFMIEANPLHENQLASMTFRMEDEYLIAALGDEEREVTFYTRSDKPHTEGNSYYKEVNYWDIPQLVQESKTKLQKLDNLFKDNTTFDLVKVDTQGSELDIIKGGQRVCKKAKYILLEVAVIEYNEKAPLENEIILFMENFGFKEFFTIGEHFNGEQLVQKDIVFKNLNIK